MSHHWIYYEVFDNMAKHYSFSESFIHRKVWKSEKLKKFIKIMITKCWRFKIGMKKCYINPTRSMIHTKRINCPKSQGSTNANQNSEIEKFVLSVRWSLSKVRKKFRLQKIPFKWNLEQKSTQNRENYMSKGIP